MHSDHKIFRRLRRNRFGIRVGAFFFLLIGSVMFVSVLDVYLDSEATIIVNGVATNSPMAKLGVLLFVSFFVLIGLAGLILPKKLMDRMLISQASLMQLFGVGIFQRAGKFLRDRPIASCVMLGIMITVGLGGSFVEEIKAGENLFGVFFQYFLILGFGILFSYFGLRLQLRIMLWMIDAIMGGNGRSD